MKRKNFLVTKPKKYVCEHCGQQVDGGRYNNHCPNCLYSKHVDDQIPGDRESNCGGLMKPVGAIKVHGKWRIIHQCLKCKKKTIVDKANDDNFDLIIDLSQNAVRVEK